MNALLRTLVFCVLVGPCLVPALAAGGKAEPQLITNVYQVAPKMFSQGSKAVDDGPALSPRKFLQRMGIRFPAGARVLFDESTSQLTLTNTLVEMEKFEHYLSGGPEDCWMPQLCAIFERIEIDRAFVDNWLQGKALDGDGSELRTAVQELLREGEARVLDTVVVKVRSGQRATVESLSEYIYPTETDLEIRSAEGQALASPPQDGGMISTICPSAHETRNVGLTLTVDAVIGADGQTIDLNLESEKIQIDGFLPMPKDGLPAELSSRAPLFFSDNLKLQVTLRNGQYAILGSSERGEANGRESGGSIILNFIRADIQLPPE